MYHKPIDIHSKLGKKYCQMNEHSPQSNQRYPDQIINRPRKNMSDFLNHRKKDTPYFQSRRLQQQHVEKNTRTKTDKNKTPDLGVIANIQQSENNRCCQAPIEQIEQAHDPAALFYRSRSHSDEIKQTAETSTADNHHEERIELCRKCHLNNFPIRPLDFSFALPSR